MCKHEQQRVQIVEIFGEIAAPLNIIHILQCNFSLLVSNKDGVLSFVEVESVGKVIIADHRWFLLGGKFIDGLYRGFDIFSDSFKGKAERIDRAFKSFEQVDAHKLPDAAFSTTTGKIAEASILTHLHIFLQLARQDEIGGRVDSEV